jgi:syntaxin-binding protein 5
MLQRHHERAFQNLSVELEESQQWKPNELTRLYFPKDYTAFEYEPVTGLLAIGTMQLYQVLHQYLSHARTGTARGSIHIFGKTAVHALLALGSDVPVKFLVISVSTSRLVCMGEALLLFITAIIIEK